LGAMHATKKVQKAGAHGTILEYGEKEGAQNETNCPTLANNSVARKREPFLISPKRRGLVLGIAVDGALGGTSLGFRVIVLNQEEPEARKFRRRGDMTKYSYGARTVHWGNPCHRKPIPFTPEARGRKTPGGSPGEKQYGVPCLKSNSPVNLSLGNIYRLKNPCGEKEEGISP